MCALLGRLNLNGVRKGGRNLKLAISCARKEDGERDGFM